LTSPLLKIAAVIIASEPVPVVAGRAEITGVIAPHSDREEP